MKRIEVTGPVVLNIRTQEGVERFVFAPRQAYEVQDAVAAHPYLAQYLLKVEDVEVRTTRKTRTKKEAKDDGSQSVPDDVSGA